MNLLQGLELGAGNFGGAKAKRLKEVRSGRLRPVPEAITLAESATDLTLLKPFATRFTVRPSIREASNEDDDM